MYLARGGTRVNPPCACDRVTGGHEQWESFPSVMAAPAMTLGEPSAVDYYIGSALEEGEVDGGRRRHSGPKGFDDGEDRSRPLVRASASGSKADAQAALGRVGTTTSECSAASGSGNGGPCSSRRVVAAIQHFVSSVEEPGAPKGAPKEGAGVASETLPAADTPEARAVRRAAWVLGCASESCVVTHPRFRAHVQTQGAGLESAGGTHLLDIELDRRFKTEGPRDSTQLLSNFNIDGVLQEWAAEFPEFFNFSFNMMDFETVGGSLARTDVAEILEGRATQNLGKMGGLVRRPCRTFACVLNTDVSTGRGKHWVAVFGDCRGDGEWTVEYFNSAGNPPPGPVTRWLESSAARLAEYRARHPRKYGTGAVTPVPLTDVRHQDSQTECGNYALFYIRRRLEGAPLSEFRDTRIPDDAMVEFRKHLFRAK